MKSLGFGGNSLFLLLTPPLQLQHAPHTQLHTNEIETFSGKTIHGSVSMEALASPQGQQMAGRRRCGARGARAVPSRAHQKALQQGGGGPGRPPAKPTLRGGSEPQLCPFFGGACTSGHLGTAPANQRRRDGPELGGGQGQPGKASEGPLGLYQGPRQGGGAAPGPYHLSRGKKAELQTSLSHWRWELTRRSEANFGI